MAYLNDIEALTAGKSHAKTVAGFIQIEHLERALATRAAYAFKELSETLKKSEASDMEKTNELFALDIELAAKLHMEYQVVTMARSYYHNHTFRDTRIRPVLDLLIQIFALKLLMKDSEGLYETGFFGAGASELQREAFKQLLTQLRPHMIPLAEGWPQLDTVYTVIGNKWGDIYEAQLDFARKSRLNQNPVPPYYQTLIKPIMEQRKHKL